MPYPRYRGHLLAVVLLGPVHKRLENLVERRRYAGIFDATGPELDVAHLDRLGVEILDNVSGQLRAGAVGDVTFGGKVWVFDDAADQLVAIHAGVEAWLDEPERLRLVSVRHRVCGKFGVAVGVAVGSVMAAADMMVCM